MKLASIILPLIDNEGADLFFTHQQLKYELLTRWNGYTSYETIGGWHGANGMVEGEKAIRYEIAMDRAETPRLRAIALDLCRKANQEAVMIVTPNGDVEFVRRGLTAVAEPA